MARESGLITGIVGGILLLIILVIIGLVIIQNVAIVEDGLSSSTETRTLTQNETEAWINGTDYTLLEAGYPGFTNPIILTAYNQTENTFIDSGNWTVTNAGVVSNTTLSIGYNNVSLTYQFDYEGTTLTTQGLRENFTKGISNVSNKLPTILLIAAVVLILGVLVFLWANFKKMQGLGGGSGSGGEL